MKKIHSFLYRTCLIILLGIVFNFWTDKGDFNEKKEPSSYITKELKKQTIKEQLEKNNHER